MIRRMEKIGMEVNSNSIIYFIVFPRFFTGPKESLLHVTTSFTF